MCFINKGKGLTSAQAARLLKENGPNEIQIHKRQSPLMLFVAQFKDFLILILAAATCFSITVGEYYEAISIIAIMLLNAFMGFIQEYRTEKALEALMALSAPTAEVVRSDARKTVPASEVVTGDYVLLGTGSRIPADISLEQQAGLKCDESILTGESAAVSKTVGSVACMGCGVVAGHGAGVVVKTGMHTKMGEIAGMISSIKPPPTPLQQRLASLSKFIAAACLSVCALVAALGVLRGEALLDMVLTGLSLAVAAVPEGLPAIVTIVLALSVGRILKKGAIIRKLHAVESLGCASVICCDKTGTLTENRMTVVRVWCAGELYTLGGSGNSKKGALLKNGSPLAVPEQVKRLAAAAALSCDAHAQTRPDGTLEIAGSPTETAVCVAAAKLGAQKLDLTDKYVFSSELPFDSARKYMSISYNSGAETFIKGAPDRVLSLCGIPQQEGALVVAAAAKLASQAYRVMGFARKAGGTAQFLGLMAMEDPPRPQVPAALAVCRRAGIKTIMITGDHEATACAVARKTGLSADGLYVTGAQIDEMDDAELSRALKSVRVFARVSPEHKLRIVRALKSSGEVVAMTGDGVNDAPAVKQADVGVAMGISGTDVTKQASSVVIADDNFATIVCAVEEGRIIYRNIKSFIRYLLTSNLGEVLTVFVAMLMGLPTVFAPIQLLLINLVTDGLPAIALGMESRHEGIMDAPPRKKNESLFAGGLAADIIVRAVVLGLFNVLCYALALAATADHAAASSAACITLVFAQMAYIVEGKILSVLKPLRTSDKTEKNGRRFNPALLGAVLLSAGVTLLCIYLPPLQGVFKTAAPGGPALLIALGCTGLCALVGMALGRLIQKKPQ